MRTRLPASGDKEQWLLIKERDEVARPPQKFSITEAMPDSVITMRGKKPRLWLSPASDDRPAVKRSKANSSREASVPADAASLVPESLTGARKAALPRTLKPQLATLVESIPREGNWSYEIKFDGYHLTARVSGMTVRLFTRNGHDWTNKMPALAGAIKKLAIRSAWLDGEIVVPGKNNVPSFQALRNAFDSENTRGIQFYLFDLPFLDGYDLSAAPLSERRELLRRLVASQDDGPLHFSENFIEKPDHLLASACRLSLEGIIGQRSDAPYESRRTKTWIKLKCHRRQEFVIAGFTEPKGSRSAFGALLLGAHDEGGDLRYAGRAGTGFDDKILQSVHSRLNAADRWNIGTLPQRLADTTRDAWAPPGIPHTITAAMKKKPGAKRARP